MADFEILEHTADIGIRVRGASLADVFCTAALALQSLSLESSDVQSRTAYAIAATGEDREALLVNWLNEVIYWIDARSLVFARFEMKAFSDFEIRAEGWGEERDMERHPMHLVVKAATYHQLRIVEQSRDEQRGEWMAEVFLDI